MKIGDRSIGPNQDVYVIAEIGVNHDGSADRALEMIDACAEAGADAVKFQSFTASELMSSACSLAGYQEEAGETDAIEMLARLQLTAEDLGRCAERAHNRGIHAIVTPFTLHDLERVASLPWGAYKTASPDVINQPLLRAIADTGRPMIVSTGASTLDEVVRASGWLGDAQHRVCFLQCVSAYPTPLAESAMGGIADIARATGRPVGYSDHTDEVSAGAIAVALGACALEKHVTHDPGASGPDHRASLSYESFASYTRLARAAAGMRGRRKELLGIERDVRTVSRQSLISTREIAEGETISREMLAIKRPGTGIEPWRVDEIVGRAASRAIGCDVPIVEDDLS